MRSGWLLVGLVLYTVPVWAAPGTTGVESWYVRPIGACANNGDGLAYECAASPGASGAFLEAAPSNVIWTTTTGVDDGDTLYICGAQTLPFTMASTISGTLGARISLRFDCPGNTGSIRRVTDMTEALTAGNWTNESGNLWYLSLASYTWQNPRRVWRDSVELVPSTAKNVLGTNAGGPVSSFWYDSSNQRLYLYATANPATTMSLLESLVAGAETCSYTTMCLNNGNAYIDIINPTLIGGNLSALYLLGANHVRVYGTALDDSLCLIGQYGFRGVLISDTTTGGTGTTSSDVEVHDCTVDPIFPDSFIGINWSTLSTSDGIDMAYGSTGARITSNTLKNWAHVNINMDATSGTLPVSGSWVANNTITCERAEYCRAFTMDGTAINQNTNNWFVGNMVVGANVRSQMNGNGNYFVANIYRDQRSGTVKPIDSGESIAFEGYAGPSQDHVVAFNTFLNNTHAPCLSIRSGAATKSNILIANNLFVNCGGPDIVGYENAAVVLENHASVGNQTFKNNLIYDSAETATVFYKATGLTTVAGFQSACSGDVCSGNLSSDPLLMSETDVRLRTTSPGYRAGVGTVCRDYRGRVCPPDSPNIGAYQSSSGDPAATRETATTRTAASARQPATTRAARE